MAQNDQSRRQRQEVYRFRVSYVLRFILAIILRQKRSLALDIAATLEAAQPPPRIVGDHHLPKEGPFVLVANHYERPGLKVFWAGMLVSRAVQQLRGDNLRWLMTSEWYNYRLGPIPIPVFMLRWLFRQIAYVYGLIIMPRATDRIMGRAAAMRSVLEVVHKQGEPIALFPEIVGKEELIRPPEAVGAFLLSLSERGVTLIPAAIFEEEGALTARFGPPFSLQVAVSDKAQRYQKARDQVMLNIGRLLPRRHWGAYTLDIEQLLSREQMV